MGKSDKIRGLVTALAAVGARLELAEAENRGLRKRLAEADKKHLFDEWDRRNPDGGAGVAGRV